MTPTIAKAVFVAMAVGWYLIRFNHARRSRRTPIRVSARDWRENLLLAISLCGLGVVPILYVATTFPRVARYPFHPLQAGVGCAVAAGALAMFYLTHRALGRNWSVSLDVRQDHRLITSGIYGTLRHPMYTAFWLWAVAQALLLPNWVAGLSGLVGFGTLFFGRVDREEQMMLTNFGAAYQEYMSRTYRLIPGIY